MRALLVKTDHHVERAELSEDMSERLTQLQAMVGGYIESVPMPFGATGFINEEGKLEGLEPNMNATVLYYAGLGVTTNDIIVGNLVVLGGIETRLTAEEEPDPDVVGVNEWQIALMLQLLGAGAEVERDEDDDTT